MCIRDSTRGVVIVILLILKSPLLNKVFPTKVFHIFLCIVYMLSGAFFCQQCVMTVSYTHLSHTVVSSETAAHLSEPVSLAALQTVTFCPFFVRSTDRHYEAVPSPVHQT